MRQGQRTSWLSLAAWVVVFASATLTRADADLWGHLRFGLDYLRDFRIPTIDPYSFTQDVPWINHEWLSEAQMALAWRFGHSLGLALLKSTLVVSALVLVWTSLADARFVGRIGVMVAISFGTIHMWATLRPQLWSFIAIAVLCRALSSGRRGVLLLSLPALFAIWVNCHGGWVVGLGIVGAWAVGRVVANPSELARWIGVCFVCAAATLINPYGLGLWRFMLQTVHMTRDVAEWAPLWNAPWLNWVPWFAGCALVVWMCWPPVSTAALRARAPAVFVLAMLAVAGARVMRIESIFVTAAAILGAPFLASRWPAGPPASGLSPAPARLRRLTAVTAIAVSCAIMWRTTQCIQVFGDWAPDSAIGHALDGSESGRLVTYFDWGEWAIWHFGPRLKVSIDGRRETVYSDERLAQSQAIALGRLEGLRALALWDAEYVWLPASSLAARRWLVANGYRIDVSGSRSFVAVRADLPVLRPLKGPLTDADCFPQ